MTPSTVLPAGQTRLERRRAGLGPPRRPGIGFVAALCVGYVLLLILGRDQWFLLDEWAFIGPRYPLLSTDYLEYLLRPHNEHWHSFDGLMFQMLLPRVGLRQYVAYLAVSNLFHVGVVVALRGVLRRVGLSPFWATAAACTFILFGRGSQNLISAFQIGFVASVAFGLAHLLASDHDGRIDRRDVLGLLLGALGVASSGVALTFVVVVGVNLALRRRWWACALAVVPLLAMHGLWRVAYRSELDLPHASNRELMQLPEYVWRGLGWAIESTVHLSGAAAALVIAVAAVATVMRADQRSMLRVPTAMALGAVFFYATTGFARLSLGIDQAASSRYAYVGAVLVFPFIAQLLRWLLAHRPVGPVAVAAVLLWAAVANGAELAAQAANQADTSRTTRDTVLAVASLEGIERLPSGIQPIGSVGPDLTIGDLVRIRDDGWLPDDAVGPQAVVDAAATVGVAVQPQGSPVSDPVVVREAADDGCVRVVAGPQEGGQVVLAPPGDLAITPSSSVTGFTVTVRSEGVSSQPRALELASGVESVVTFAGGDLEVVVAWSGGGSVVLCGQVPASASSS